MKRLLGLAIAVVMLFTLVIAVPASAEEENVALGKPVLAMLNGGNPADANYWRAEYLTDGVAQDTTNGNALGWAFSSPIYAGPNIDSSAYIDLGAVYSVDSVVVVPMQWVPAATFPGAYEVYLSTDFTNWTKVVDCPARAAATEGNDVYTFDAVEAQYVRFRATCQSGAWADDAFYYYGIGEVEVYGTKVRDTNNVIKVYNNYTGDIVNVPAASAEETLGVPTVWIGHTSGSLEWQMTFQTDVGFWGINFPASWGYYATPLRLTIEKTADNSVVLTKEFSRCGDGALTIDLGTTIPAGQYVMKLTIREDTLAAEGQYLFYNVLGHAYDMLDDEYCINTNGTDIEEHAAVQLYSFDDGQGFVKLGTEVPPETQPETEPASYELHGASFDTIYVNDVMNFGQSDGAASDKLDGVGRTVDGSDGSVQTIRLRGWIGFETEIAELGYQINGKNTFGDYKVAPEAAVTDPANGGQYATRFDMTIDVSNLKGTNKIVAVAKLADGTIVKIDENISANGAGTTPNTSFTYIGPADENAQTGDFSVAMFAVLAVLAMGAAVVFAKKRSF